MPSFMPDASVARTLDEKLTFFGDGVNALYDVIEAIRAHKGREELDELGREIWDFIHGPLADGQRYESPQVKYLPQTEQEREFVRRLILRGEEVDAFLAMLDETKVEGVHVERLRSFRERYIDEQRRGHVDISKP